MVVIVLVVPSPTNGHNSDKSETIHPSNSKYDINNNDQQWSLKHEIAQTYNYAARDYRKSNNVASSSSGGTSNKYKNKDSRRFFDNTSKFYSNNNGHHINNNNNSSYNRNSFVRSDACNNNSSYNNKSSSSKNYARHITRITISDDFSQTEIGSDQLAEAVTKEGEFLHL